MDKKLFERLVQSMQQHEEIRRGEWAPSREFFVDAEKVKKICAMGFARRNKTRAGPARCAEQEW